MYWIKTKISLLALLASCACLPAQHIQLKSVATNGTVTWTQGLTNAIATVEWTTNLGSGIWLPVRGEFVSNSVCTAQIPAGQMVTGFYRIAEADISSVPRTMGLVPAGYFQMGDPYSEAGDDPSYWTVAQPLHDVYISSFYIDRLDVSNAFMVQTLQWAYNQGLIGATSEILTNREGNSQTLLDLNDLDPESHIVFSNGLFSVSNGCDAFPISAVTWYGAAAFCNYRSDMEGLPRCFNFTNWDCDFTQKGYRLPTEAEWEKAARGGMTGQHYAWESYGGSYSNFINGGIAKYHDSRDPYYYQGFWTVPVGYYNGNQLNFGQPVHTNVINGYGLYDMGGNVWDWCWDGFEDDWYSQPGATQPDPRGPVGLLTRVIRGGSFGYGGSCLVCACRDFHGFGPTYESGVLGFRCVRLPP